jgi:hypothetical protein
MTANETDALLVGLRALLRAMHTPEAGGAPPLIPEHEHGFQMNEAS